MTEIINSYREAGQPSVAVYAFDTVIRRQGALDDAAARARELERVANAEQKREARRVEAREKSYDSPQIEIDDTRTEGPAETYASDGNQPPPPLERGGQINVQV